MCGICGLVTFRPDRTAEEDTVRRMAETIRHRGPDEDGFLFEPGVGLGMRRLSIIDLAGGRQPIHNEDQSVWTVFNGEIYNYPSLKEDLQHRGHCFYTQSDTEVIVHAYEEWGDDFLGHLNGMFGLAVWDRKRRRVILARDRVGIKPLYYAHHKGILAFGSELKALMAWDELPRELDLVSVQQYLALEHIPAPRTIFMGIQKLPAGCCLVFDAAGLEMRRYWDVDLVPSEIGPKPTLSEAREGLLKALRESVRLEMISDVPLGVFLSGGIDSSAVAAMMSEIAPGQVSTFCVGFDDPSFDESRYADLVANRLGTRHHSVRLDPRELWELVPGLPEILDEPMADGSIMPTFVLCKFARRHVKVALGGDGGDELLAGYSTLQAHRLTQLYLGVPSALRRRVIEPLVERLPVNMDNLSFDYKAKRFIRDAASPAPVRHHRWLGGYPQDQIEQVLSSDVLGQLNGSNALEPVDRYSSSFSGSEELNRILYLDMKLYMESDILVKVDRASMANSLEVRVPLLNKVMVDYVNALPFDLKLKGYTRKYIFREAMKGRLPDEILRRPKKGFGMPIAKWLRGELRDLALDTLSERSMKQAGVFEPSYVQLLLKDHMEGRADNRKQLWSLLVFQMWYNRYGAAVQVL